MIGTIKENAAVSGDYKTILAELFTLTLELRNVGIRTVDIFNTFVTGLVTDLSAYRPDTTPEEYKKEEERLLAMSSKDKTNILNEMIKAERNMQ